VKDDAVFNAFSVVVRGHQGNTGKSHLTWFLAGKVTLLAIRQS